MNNERYQVNINYEGLDYLMEVGDVGTANLLINDAAAAHQFITKLLEESKSNEIIQSVEQSADPVRENGDYDEQGESETSSIEAATQKSEKRSDTNVIGKLKKMGKQFADKATRKSKLWTEIAQNLIEKGYRLGENAGEKCRQKFSNLQRTYTKYIINQKTTGSETMETPPYYDEMQEILGDQHKINPVFLLDTLEDTNLQEASTSRKQENPSETPPATSKSTLKETCSSTASSRCDIENRFSKVRGVKSCSKKSDLIKEMEQDRKERSEEFVF